jgi:hypothetical protein
MANWTGKKGFPASDLIGLRLKGRWVRKSTLVKPGISSLSSLGNEGANWPQEDADEKFWKIINFTNGRPIGGSKKKCTFWQLSLIF